jgi:lipoprotein-releasing system permease protein
MAFQNQPILRIAFVHLVSKKRQTLVAMLGVMFGITVFIFQAGLITGLQSYMIDKIVNNSPHIHLYNEPEKNPPPLLKKVLTGSHEWIVLRSFKQLERDRKIRSASSIMAQLRANPAVLGVAPLVQAQAILRAGYKEVPATVNGVEIDRENQLFNIYKDQIEGDFSQMTQQANGMILGIGVAQKLGASVGDVLTLSTAFATLDMKVVSITQTGVTQFDDNRVYANLRTTQKLLGKDMLYLTDLNLKLRDVNQADRLADELTKIWGLKAQSWKEANAGVFGVFKIQNIATVLVIASILIVAGFGIFNILMMMIYEKMQDIAIMKSMGYRNGDIRRLFMLEAMVIGVSGGLLGIGFGYLASVAATKIEIQLKGLVTLDHLTINFDPLFYVSGFLFALFSTALAGYFPARKASLVDPVEIIRGK